MATVLLNIIEPEIVELFRDNDLGLSKTNNYLPRVGLEYDQLKAELNSRKAELSNSVRIYQDFCDRNIALKKYTANINFYIFVQRDSCWRNNVFLILLRKRTSRIS